MKIAHLLLLASLALVAAPALAQQSGGAGKTNPKDQESLREKFLQRWKDKSGQHSTYGQGFGSRPGAKSAPPKDAPSRPERPEHPQRPGR